MPSSRVVRITAYERLLQMQFPGGMRHRWSDVLQIGIRRGIVAYRYTDYRYVMPKRKLDPLPSAAFQILLSLAGEDLHGYGIMRQVADQTDDRMRLGPGTLYSSIQTLLEEKFIEEIEPREDLKLGHERRRYYRLTSAGRKVARSEATRLGDLLRVARARKIFRGDYV
jgi:DNA-binding PadR family transcriptional regulator